ncbi:hypothetical protein LPQ06_28350 [Klebsiella pneumoniae]|nr:hypothetical protein [Klebsiella pneumoniae]
MSTTSKQEAPAAKHAYYVSLENGVIYPAMTSPAGYEDEHPSEYRPATQEEVDAYKNGADTTRPYAQAQQVEASREVAVPRAIRLEDEPGEVVPAAPLVPPPPAFVVPPSAE